MVLHFNTNHIDGTTITLPLNGTVNVTVDWGDGSSETVTNAGNLEHTYSSEGKYRVSIAGTLTKFGQYYSMDLQDNLDSVSSWGDLGITSFEGAFIETTNLSSLPTDIPPTVTNTNKMFYGSSFNGDISNWDVSNVINMNQMFAYSSFNGNISNWNVSNVTEMVRMFDRAQFNNDLSGWNVSNVTTMSSMFSNVFLFNSDISNWNVSNVTNMYSMFKGASSFNGDIGGWNVSNVTNMGSMFNDVILLTEQYDEILTQWSQLTLQPNVTFSAGLTMYTAIDPRQKIIDDFAWTIEDCGLPAIPIESEPMVLHYNTNNQLGTKQ